MSEHKAVVIPINLIPHPNADTLSLVNVGGFTVVVKTSDWIDKDKAIYIEPETCVKTTLPQFSFLDNSGKSVKIKVKRLRGVYSQGLLIPAPDNANIGDNFFEQLECVHYEPEMEHISTGGNWEKAPPIWSTIGKYDIENLRNQKIRNLFIDNEIITASIKYNGSNISFGFTEDKIYVRSRSGFRTEEDNIFWRCLKSDPNIEKFIRDNPNTLIFGECCGNIKGFKYDATNGVNFKCFDILKSNLTYMDYNEWLDTCDKYNINKVKNVKLGPFDYNELLNIADMDCPYGGINEGIVVRPVEERRDYYCGRVIGKIISNKYLEKN